MVDLQLKESSGAVWSDYLVTVFEIHEYGSALYPIDLYHQTTYVYVCNYSQLYFERKTEIKSCGKSPNSLGEFSYGGEMG